MIHNTSMKIHKTLCKQEYNSFCVQCISKTCGHNRVWTDVNPHSGAGVKMSWWCDDDSACDWVCWKMKVLREEEVPVYLCLKNSAHLYFLQLDRTSSQVRRASNLKCLSGCIRILCKDVLPVCMSRQNHPAPVKKVVAEYIRGLIIIYIFSFS